jgi:MFS family permease
VFAFPNIFTTLILGILIDFLGVRIGVISLSIGVALAQLIVAFGGQYYSYNTLLIGRMIFGIASESLITAQASIMSFWFKGKELAFALGIILTSPELGNALNSYLSPIVYESTQSLGAPLFLSVGFCVLSVICGVILVYIDMKADKVTTCLTL